MDSNNDSPCRSSGQHLPSTPSDNEVPPSPVIRPHKPLVVPPMLILEPLSDVSESSDSDIGISSSFGGPGVRKLLLKQKNDKKDKNSAQKQKTKSLSVNLIRKK